MQEAQQYPQCTVDFLPSADGIKVRLSPRWGFCSQRVDIQATTEPGWHCSLFPSSRSAESKPIQCAGASSVSSWGRAQPRVFRLIISGWVWAWVLGGRVWCAVLRVDQTWGVLSVGNLSGFGYGWASLLGWKTGRDRALTCQTDCKSGSNKRRKAVRAKCNPGVITSPSLSTWTMDGPGRSQTPWCRSVPLYWPCESNTLRSVLCSPDVDQTPCAKHKPDKPKNPTTTQRERCSTNVQTWWIQHHVHTTLPSWSSNLVNPAPCSANGEAPKTTWHS